MTTVAFFDLDYTLLNTSSGIIYFQEIIKWRRAPLWYVSYLSLGYQFKRIGFGEAHIRLMALVGRRGRRETLQFFSQRVTPRVLARLAKPGLDKIEWHKKQGHQVVINSASIEELVKPVADHLGVDYVCTCLAVENDRYTGRLNGPACYGQGKVEWAKRWLQQNQLPYPDTIGYFYTDSSSDLPLLELARQPIAVNPSRKLRKIARARGWPVERFY